MELCQMEKSGTECVNRQLVGLKNQNNDQVRGARGRK